MYQFTVFSIISFQASINSPPLNSSAPQYLSNESVTDDEDLSREVVKRSRGSGKDWIFVQNFDDPKMAEEVVAEDFKIDYQHKTSTGPKNYYYCKHQPCPAKFQICYNRSTTVLLKSSDHDHNTTPSAPARLTRISEETKSKIKELRELKLKPKAILSTIRNKYPELPVPSVKQLYGLNSREAKDESKISLGELEQWLKERSTIPVDEHSVFVVHYEVDYDAPSFRFFLSTKNLIEQSSKSNIVHADTTYKLNYEGFPVLVIGTTDLDRHLHPSGVSVCTDEKTADFEFIFQTLSSAVSRVLGQSYMPTTLVADAAEAIHNGFTAVFGMLLIIMCWAHVKRAIYKRYRGKSNLDKILSDLDLLQLSPSIEAFQIALKLFFEKWKEEKEFLAYFKEQWVDHNGNWYEGLRKFTPKTDNALEGKNRWIKDSHTMRDRLPLVQFLNELLKMVNDWSCDYIKDKVFITQPTIDLPLWTSAYQWVKLSKRVIVSQHLIDLDEKVYSFKIPSSNFDTVVEFDLSHCKSLDEFKKFAFAYYTVEMPSNNWRKGSCTCPSFYKMFICKHLVGMAMRYRLVEPPLAAKSVPLGQKRKRGRPKKAKHALLVA